eukprot:scaffold51787_cov14-Prasinocladus_malaysianus.AAC.1
MASRHDQDHGTQLFTTFTNHSCYITEKRRLIYVPCVRWALCSRIGSLYTTHVIGLTLGEHVL